MTRGPEAKEQDKLIKYLDKTLNWYVIKLVAASKAGKPDIIACDLQGRFWAFEVKRKGETARKLQEWNIKQLTDRHALAFTIDSFEMAKNIISEYQQKFV